MPRRPYPRWRDRHHTVLKLLMEGPLMEGPCPKQKDIAHATGYSPWQVSRIINSPDFRRRYEQARKRKEAIVDALCVRRELLKLAEEVTRLGSKLRRRA